MDIEGFIELLRISRGSADDGIHHPHDPHSLILIEAGVGPALIL